MKILVVEDVPEIIEAISLAFHIRWPEAQLISTGFGEKAVDIVENDKPDAVILDLGLPDISGFDVLRRIRLFSDVPVLILTVRAEEADVVKGLEWGADDYMVKPFRQLELLSRVKALIRRRGTLGAEPPMVCGPLQFNPATGQLVFDTREISLTPTEGSIMNHLMKNAGQTVTHSSLAESVWGADYPDAADSLKVYIRRLRQKLEDDPGNPRLILTKAGIGYQLARQ